MGQIEPALAFYRDVIGFEVMMRIPSLVAVSAGGYHHHLNLNSWAGDDAPPDSEDVAGLSEWELRVPDESARQALRDRIRRAGALGTDSGSGIAHDPDGITVKIGPG